MSSDKVKAGKDLRFALLSDTTSRRNKMALLAQCQLDNIDVEYCWKGTAYETRLLVLFDQTFCDTVQWQQCKSYDEDVRPLLKSGKEK